MSPNHSPCGQPRLACHINIVGEVLVLLARLWGGEQGKGRQRKKSRLEKGLQAPSAVHAAHCIMCLRRQLDGYRVPLQQLRNLWGDGFVRRGKMPSRNESGGLEWTGIGERAPSVFFSAMRRFHTSKFGWEISRGLLVEFPSGNQTLFHEYHRTMGRRTAPEKN